MPELHHSFIKHWVPEGALKNDPVFLSDCLPAMVFGYNYGRNNACPVGCKKVDYRENADGSWSAYLEVIPHHFSGTHTVNVSADLPIAYGQPLYIMDDTPGEVILTNDSALAHADYPNMWGRVYHWAENYSPGWHQLGDQGSVKCVEAVMDHCCCGAGAEDTFATVSGSVITFPNGDTVDLASFDTDTDTYATYAGTTITFPNGETVDLASFDTDTDTFSSLTGSTITFPNGDTITIMPPPPAANASPLADNRADTDLRAAVIGTSTDYAREDHKHPIRRQANPGDPVVTFSGNGVMDQAIVIRRWSDEETYYYRFRCRVAIPDGIGWQRLIVPLIGGFQYPRFVNFSQYRYSLNPPQVDENSGNGANGAMPRGQIMTGEAHNWSGSNQIYIGAYRRDNPFNAYVEFTVAYTRN